MTIELGERTDQATEAKANVDTDDSAVRSPAHPGQSAPVITSVAPTGQVMCPIEVRYTSPGSYQNVLPSYYQLGRKKNTGTFNNVSSNTALSMADPRVLPFANVNIHTQCAPTIRHLSRNSAPGQISCLTRSPAVSAPVSRGCMKVMDSPFVAIAFCEP